MAPAPHAPLDRTALTVGLFVWQEPYLWTELARVGRPQRFSAHAHAGFIAPRPLEAIPPRALSS